MEDLVREVLQHVQRERRLRPRAQGERPVEQQVTLVRIDARQHAKQRARLSPHGRRLRRAAPQPPDQRRDLRRRRCTGQLVLPHQRDAKAEQRMGGAIVSRSLQCCQTGGPAVCRVGQRHDPCVGLRHGLSGLSCEHDGHAREQLQDQLLVSRRRSPCSCLLLSLRLCEGLGLLDAPGHGETGAKHARPVGYKRYERACYYTRFCDTQRPIICARVLPSGKIF